MTKYIPLAKLIIQDALKEQVKYYGIEALEEAIQRVYCTMPKTRDIILDEYYEIYGKRKNNF